MKSFAVLLRNALCFLVLGLLVMGGLSNTAVHSSTPGQIDPVSLLVTSCHAAQDAIRPRLLTPGAARFPDCSDSSYTVHTNSDKSRVYIEGVVDSQNAFGAYLRRPWAAFLHRDGGSDLIPQWSVDKALLIGR